MALDWGLSGKPTWLKALLIALALLQLVVLARVGYMTMGPVLQPMWKDRDRS